MKTFVDTRGAGSHQSTPDAAFEPLPLLINDDIYTILTAIEQRVGVRRVWIHRYKQDK